MSEKTPNQLWLMFESFERRDDMGFEFIARFTTQIGQFMLFDRRPDLLIRIEFRTVGGQLFQPNDAMIVCLQKGFDDRAAMDRGSIPDHGQSARGRLTHLPQKPHDVLALIAAVLYLIVQVAGRRDQTDDGKVTIAIPVAQHRRWPCPSPRHAHAGDQIERGFIRIPNHACGAFRRFHISGQRVVFQSVTASDG